MSKLENARKIWVGKSDEWLYERLANELTAKVQEIHRLLKEIDEVKSLTISDVIEHGEQLVCDCQDYENGLVSELCPLHNFEPYTPD